MTDPFGRAIRDAHYDRYSEPLRRIDGSDREDHPIEALYFETFAPEDAEGERLVDHLQGPLLDLGCGVGRHALFFQERFETVAVEASEAIVATARDRGVEDVRFGDMFALRERFSRDRFRSAMAVGTQLGLAESMRGLSAFLGDLAAVTTADATAMLDAYDPAHPASGELLGHRGDPTPSLAFRLFHFEYEGTVGPELLVRLWSPRRLREATVGTGWTLSTVRRGDDGPYYRTFFEKSGA